MDQLIDFFLAWGGLGLAMIAFAESSFFPIPPDLLLIPLSLASPDKALLYAFITTLFSVTGSLLGYFLGSRFGRPLLYRFAKPATVMRVEKMFHLYGTWSITIAGFTPIPYKVFTIAAGVFRSSIPSLLVGSLIGRGLRFLGEAFIILALGTKAGYFLNSYAGISTSVIALLIILIYFFLKKSNIRLLKINKR